eukprot:UN04523
MAIDNKGNGVAHDNQPIDELQRVDSVVPFELPSALAWIPVATQHEIVWLSKLGGPLALSFLAQYACTLIVIHFQGRQGDNFLAACSFVVFYTQLFLANIITAINSGIDSLATQAYGAGLKKNVGLICLRAFFFQLCMLPVTIFLLVFSEGILNAMGFDPNVTPLSQGYMRVYVWSSVPIIIIDTIRRAQEAAANPFPSTFASFFSFVLAYPVNYLMVYSFGMGAIGSAYAQNIINYATCACLLAYCYLSGVYKETWPHTLDPKVILNPKDLFLYLRYALPSAGMMLSEFLSFECVVVITAQISKNDVAANLLIYAVHTFIYHIPLSYGVAAATRIGQLLGANKGKRAKHSFVVILQVTMITQVVLAVLVLLLSTTIPQWFTDDEIILEIVTSAMPLLALFAILNGLGTVMAGILRGIGKQRFMFVVNILLYWILAVPLAYYLALHVSEHSYISDEGERLTREGIGIEGTWLALNIAGFGVQLIYFFRLFYNDWIATAQDVSEKHMQMQQMKVNIFQILKVVMN